MDKVQVDILGLSSSPSSGGAYALLLKESYGVRRLPIIIGGFEAQSIALELEGIKPPRPLTHDLIKSLIDNLGANIPEIIISDLIDNTFYAKIILDVSSLTNEIDSRPSDAIAIAVRTRATIYVCEEVMQAASFIPTSKDVPKQDEEISDEEIIEETLNEMENPATTKIASLQDQLREAIEKEDYERAAKLRDEINKISGGNN